VCTRRPAGKGSFAHRGEPEAADQMSNFPFNDPITISHLRAADLEELLRGFEDAWAATNDERISSEAFYERYRSGEVDSVYATAWATYYEIAIELERRREVHVEGLPGVLLGA
jgi:hypothetical protein